MLALQRRDIAKRGQILQNRLCRMSSVLLYIARQWGGAYGLGITYAKSMFNASEGGH